MQLRHSFLPIAGFIAFFPALAMAAPSEAWPYWPEYVKTPVHEIVPQVWNPQEHSIDGWDWSLPPGTQAATHGILSIYRVANIEKPLGKEIRKINLPINAGLEFWVKWADLEPKEGVYRFESLKARIAEADALGCSVVVRMLCSATIFAPKWISEYGIPLREENSKNPPKVQNFELSHSEFHKRYLKLIRELGKSGIPQIKAVKGAYVGYASPSYGDEGIGPHGVDPDSVPHVVERLDEWAAAFKGYENKVFMGGHSKRGFEHGFGVRRGFVEMYLYHIPSPEIGQLVDDQRYLYVDENVDIIKRNSFHGEENEEYEESWATEQRGFRFGKNTDSFTYRYFISNLRTLQMRCNHLLVNPFSIYPEQMVWLGQTLGRTIEDTPDIWCALRESYIRDGGKVKNMERWLYQRDSEGYETTPDVKVDHPIPMWMVQKDQHHDYVARKGKRIGFAVDHRWHDGKPLKVAVKVTYFDKGTGAVGVGIYTKAGLNSKYIHLENTGKLKTATFLVDDAIFPQKGMSNDIVIKSFGDEVSLSFVRIIKINP